MSDLSNFESRSGEVTSSAEDIFAFVTDLRNFERFVPQGTVTNWKAEQESCSFSVAMIGTVSLVLTEKVKYNRVVYYGDALNKNDFSLLLHISGNDKNPAEVKIHLSADLNPMMKMMAAKPIAQFLEMLISEMEKFRDWKDIRG
jgi:hypothetical protein